MIERIAARMTADEVAAFIDEARTVVLAVPRVGDLPHVSALWFVPVGPQLHLWSYGTSQKVVSLRRDPRSVALMEDGDNYRALRGLSMDCDVEIVENPTRVLAIGVALARRYASGGVSEPAEVIAERQGAAQRVGLVLTPTRVRSWDHRKLGRQR